MLHFTLTGINAGQSVCGAKRNIIEDYMHVPSTSQLARHIEVKGNSTDHICPHCLYVFLLTFAENEEGELHAPDTILWEDGTPQWVKELSYPTWSRMNSAPKDYKVGQWVKLTPKSLNVIRDGSRSIKAFPSRSFVQALEQYEGKCALVTHRFMPGYEMSVRFPDGAAFHIKDNWVEPAEVNAYRVWPDDTVQAVEDGEPYSHMSDDFVVTHAPDEECALIAAKRMEAATC